MAKIAEKIKRIKMVKILEKIKKWHNLAKITEKIKMAKNG